ncbi:Uncharacterised protein [Mycobacteroides abscessus subsp. abscessus]|nr:Uncharacterised protein [Mycobacteroides abscessus subsp. abscessus]
MEPEVGRQLLAGLDAAHAVAVLIESRRIDTDAELTGQHRQDAASHTTFRRHADRCHPVARGVVHAARGHHAQQPLCDLLTEHSPSGARVGSTAGDRRTHHGEVVGGDLDRALTEVERDRGVWMGVESAEAVEHVGDRTITRPCGRLRLEDVVVERQLSAGACGVEGENLLESLLHDLGIDLADRRKEQRRRDNGSGVDHRVLGSTS